MKLAHPPSHLPAYRSSYSNQTETQPWLQVSFYVLQGKLICDEVLPCMQVMSIFGWLCHSQWIIWNYNGFWAQDCNVFQFFNNSFPFFSFLFVSCSFICVYSSFSHFKQNKRSRKEILCKTVNFKDFPGNIDIDAWRFCHHKSTWLKLIYSNVYNWFTCNWGYLLGKVFEEVSTKVPLVD